MRPFGRLLPLEEARDRVLRAACPITATEPLRLSEALGRVAAVDLSAPYDVPPFARATWDGYAVRSRDTRAANSARPVRLRLVGEVFAEGSFRRRLAPGEAVAVATGGAMPLGADAVLIFEDAAPTATEVVARRPLPPGERVAARGDDFPRGTRLVGRGRVLDPAALGAVAATGASRVRVYRRPRVTVIPNGNELSVPGERRRAGAVFEVNNTTIGAVATASGAIVRALPPVPDDPRRIAATLRSAIRTSDLVIVTGGSSVGERDYLPLIFPDLGRLLFHGVAVRPGKPTLAAVAGSTLLLGMPGHPASCLSNAFWLLLPTLRRMAHLPGPGWVEERARLVGTPRAPSPDLSTVVPLAVSGGEARPTFRDSSAITSLAGANAFAILPPGSRAPRSGSSIALHRLLPPVGASQAP